MSTCQRSADDRARSRSRCCRHVDHLFGGDLDGCQDGKIELAWTDGKDGKLRHAAIFGTDQLDELIERAIR
jgi:hypothetical protein